MWLRKNWIYGLLLVALILSILGVTTGNFIFKSGSAAIGIITIVILNFNRNSIAKDTLMILAAFVFSILGDWHLSNMNGDGLMFVKGIALFFVAHIGYLLYALMNGKIKWKFTVLLLIAYLIFFYLKLYPSFTDTTLMIATLIYLLISCISLGASIGIKGESIVKRAFVFGIFLILLSDTIISFKEFLKYDALNFLILPTYYLAHIVITYALIKKVETTQETPNSITS